MKAASHWRNTAQGYGRVTIIAHWLTALTVIGLYPLGLYIGALTYYDPAYRIVPNWHKGIGILLVAVVMLRLAWRWTNPRPSSMPGHRAWERHLASLVHGLLYGLLLAVPFSGYLISTADGRPISVFGWFSVPALIPSLGNNQADVAGLWHFWLGTLLVSLAGVHALGALKHHFIDRDSTLSRMLKPAKETNP